MIAPPRILYLDSDRSQRRVLHAELRDAGFEVTDIENFDEGVTLCQLTDFAILLMSVHATGVAVDICRSFRSVAQHAVMVVLTEAGDPNESAEILEAGADHCLANSTYVPELVARLRAAIRRSAGSTDQSAISITIGGIRLDSGRRLAYRDDVPVRLTNREFVLLRHMMMNAGVPLPHETLMKVVWGSKNAGRFEYLRHLVRQLRIKLNDNESPQYLLTESWIGYRFITHPTTAGPGAGTGAAAA